MFILLAALACRPALAVFGTKHYCQHRGRKTQVCGWSPTQNGYGGWLFTTKKSATTSRFSIT
ncbi:MAG: hypothetical protein ACI9VR_000237, partial [Cognaticolwellia sp.]